MLSFKSREPRNGSFIYFLEDGVDRSILDFIPLNKKQTRNTLETILDHQVKADSEGTVSLSDVSTFLGITSAAMNSRIRTLRKLKILVEVPFCFIGKNGDQIAKRRVLCLKVNNTSEVVMPGCEKQNMSKLAKKKHASKQAYKDLNLFPRPTLPDVISRTVRHTDSFVIEQLVVSSNEYRQKMVKAFYVTTNEGVSHQVLAQIQSFSRIINSNVLQVLFACYTLIYFYHKKSIRQHELDGTTPENLTPIHVDDILRVQQKSPGGESRK